MSISGADQYWWCVRHHRVESEANLCRAANRLGPYRTPEEASHAMEQVQERNEAWEAEDARWEGETGRTVPPL